MNTAAEFWGRVEKRDDGCWVWLLSRDEDGYGYVSWNGRVRRAHRVAWELTHGALPPRKGAHGTCVLHRCDNPPCVRPGHLFLGSVADNNRDAVQKRRHDHGAQVATAKLTEQDVREMRRLAAAGATFAALGRRFGVRADTARAAIRRVTWAHLGDES